MRKPTCKICGEKLTLDREKVYTVADETTGIIAAFGAATKCYDAIDCPICGCQNILCERKLIYEPYNIAQEAEEPNSDN